MSEGKKIQWTIASARQNFPTVIDLAAREPQEIYRRDRLVARVISADTSDDQLRRAVRPSLAETIADIQQICAEENYTLDVGPRTTRPNAFLAMLESEEPRKNKAGAARISSPRSPRKSGTKAARTKPARRKSKSR